jgi:thiamine pyrophosphokinase
VTVLYETARAVTLLGAGPVDPAQLAEALAVAPDLVAADGGADVPLPRGAEFSAVIGDLDSIGQADVLRARGVPVHAIAEQDTTDLEKCLCSVVAPLYLGVGFLGGRLDHHLAAMSALVRFPQRRVVLIGRDELCFLCPPLLDLDLAAGTRVSLFPMRPATGTLSEGLQWPVDGLALAPGGRIGTSNAATGGRLRVGFDAPGVLAILPRGELPQIVDRLAGPV